jgi:flagellar hook protein FlgE
MSLFGALFTGVSGMSAQSQATAMISNNIANVDTIGYKGDNAAFYSLVTTNAVGGVFNSGSVAVNTVQNVTQEGSIQQTSSSTDAAISGQGLFVVKQATGTNQPFLYTRSGSFSEDATGQLVNTAGDVLYAWPLDTSGNIPSNSGDLGSLVPANVAFLGGLTKPTTTADLSLNLNASQVDQNTALNSPPTSLPLNPVTDKSDFQLGLTVFDSLGSAQNLNVQFRKIVGPMANTTTSAGNLALTTSLTDPTIFGSIKAGDQFTISVNTAIPTTQKFVIGDAAGAGQIRVDTIGDLVNGINAMGGGSVATASLDQNGRLVVQSNDPALHLTMTNDGNDGLNLATSKGIPLGNGFSPPTDAGTLDFAGEPGVATATAGNIGYDGTTGVTAPNAPPAAIASVDFTPQAPVTPPGPPPGSYAGATYPNQGDFPAITNTQASENTQGWWEMTVQKPDGTTLTQGLVNFNGDGTLNASADANGVVGVKLNNVNWGNGSDLSNIDVDISKFTQFAGQYNVVATDQNGAALGLRTGVEVTAAGLVVAQFSNGATASLYKIPLATFSDPNGLEAQSGTAYTQTAGSGTVNLREPGDGGAGVLQPSALEGSNIDLADEFAKLIVSQRAFTANTRVISTVDSMTQDLLRLV